MEYKIPMRIVVVSPPVGVQLLFGKTTGTWFRLPNLRGKILRLILTRL